MWPTCYQSYKQKEHGKIKEITDLLQIYRQKALLRLELVSVLRNMFYQRISMAITKEVLFFIMIEGSHKHGRMNEPENERMPECA